MRRRRLGQHFLVRPSILERIADAAVPNPAATVLEIGPGKGALTHYLLQKAERVIAVEVDTYLVHYLQQKFRDHPKIIILNQDILKTSLGDWGPISVAGNLPYYITSPIVEKVLELGALLRSAVFLVQKEVAERIAAKSGSRDYGYLSVQTQLLAEPSILFEVAPGAFQPPPKVDSAVIRLDPRPEPLVRDVPGFLAFASTCFRQKRKTLRNNLLEKYPRGAVEALPEASLRAEQVPIEQLIQAYQRILRSS